MDGITYHLSLEENLLKVEIVPPNKDETLQYACYFQKEQQVIEKQWYKKDTVFELELKEQGIYKCICFVKTGDGMVNSLTTHDIIYIKPPVLCVFGSNQLARLLTFENSGYKVQYCNLQEELLLEEDVKVIIFDVHKIWKHLHQETLKEVINKVKSSILDVQLFYNKCYYEEYGVEQKETNHQLLQWYTFLDDMGVRCINTHQLILWDKQKEYYEQENVFAKECFRQIDEYITVDAVKRGSHFSVKVKLINNTLKIEIKDEVDRKSADVLYCYYILKDGKVYYKHNWEKSTTFDYVLTESGVYCVQGYVKSEHTYFRKSLPIEFFTDETREEYEKFLNETGQKEYIEDLPFFHGTDSKISANYVVAAFAPNSLPSEIDMPGFQVVCKEHIGGAEVYIMSDKPVKFIGDRKLLFSGWGFIHNTHVVGMEEIDNETTREQLIKGYGCYTYVDVSKDDIYIGKDPFDLQPLFYYKDEQTFFASNRYHLLLLFLKHAQKKLIPNLERMLANFSANMVQPFLQEITTEMDVEGVWQLQNDYDIIINHEGISFVQSEYGKIYTENSSITEPDYRNSLKKAKEEMLCNMEALLRNKNYENVIVDLSGGTDTRLIYGMLPDFEEYRGKVKICSDKIDGNKDLEIAVKINNIYKYNFDDLPRQIEISSLREAHKMCRSYYMGTYFSWQPMSIFHRCDRTMQLVGACGELFRPYMTRKCLKTVLEDCTVEEDFFEQYLLNISEYLICGNEEAIRTWIKLASEEARRQPVASVMEAYDRMYLQIRHNHHFARTLLGELAVPRFAPLQSREILRLHHMTFHEFKGYKILFDLTAMINKHLAGFPYENEQDNIDHRRMENILYNRPVVIPEEELDGDLSDWENANRRRSERKVQITSKNHSDATEPLLEPGLNLKEELWNHLRILCRVRNRYFGERVGIALFYYVKQHEDNRSIAYLNNRIMSVLDQLQICDN